MISKAEKVRLGIFIAVSGTILVAVFVALAGIKFMEKFDIYEVRFDETVSGLEIGAQVKYNGVRVGQVSSIEINPQNIDQVTIVLNLREGTPVKTDTRAILVAMGITGLKFVELTGGSNASKMLKPGSAITAGHSFMGTLEGKAESIALKAELALNKFNTLLSDKNLARVEGILFNLNEVSGRVDRLLDENDQKIDVIVDDFGRISAGLEKGMTSAGRSADAIESMLTEARPRVTEILDNLNQTTLTVKTTAQDLAKVEGVLVNLEATLNKFNGEIQQVNIKAISDDLHAGVREAKLAIESMRGIVNASSENIYQSSDLLKNTLLNLEDVSDQLRDQPSLLLLSRPGAERSD